LTWDTSLRSYTSGDSGNDSLENVHDEAKTEERIGSELGLFEGRWGEEKLTLITNAVFICERAGRVPPLWEDPNTGRNGIFVDVSNAVSEECL